MEKQQPNYEFYLRHYGSNLIPAKFVLLCRPQAKAQDQQTGK